MMSRAVASSALVGVVMAGVVMVGVWWEECEQRLKGNHRGIFRNTVSGKHLVIYHQIIIITDKLINNIRSLLGLQLPKAIRQDQILRHNINYCSLRGMERARVVENVQGRGTSDAQKNTWKRSVGRVIKGSKGGRREVFGS